MNLANKIQAYTTGVFIVLLLVISGAVYVSFSKIAYDSDTDETRMEAERIVSGINERPAPDLLRAYVPANGMIRIVRQDGSSEVNVTGGSQPYLVEQEYQFYRGEKAQIQTIENIPHAFVSVPMVWTDGEIASLQLTQSLEATADTLSILRLVLLIVTVLAIIPLFSSAFLLSKLITTPIRSLIETMQQIRGSGQFKKIDTPEKSKDELHQMANTFNKMMDQLQENYHKQEQFVSNASHELKTPLTVIESYSSLLKRRGKQDEELFDESVEAIHSEARRMHELIQQLLLLAKQEENWDIKMADTPLLPIVQSTVTSFEKAYQRPVVVEADDDAQVWTDGQKLKQLLYIFMDNARKYSDHSISVTVGEMDGKVVLKIIDQGIGMTAEEMGKVFDRFYQVDQSRAEGYGLGLSLAKELARAIGVEIKLDSKKGEGTTATLFLPLSQ